MNDRKAKAAELKGSSPLDQEFSPLDQEFLRDTYSIWTRAQHEQPVFYYPELGYWVVTRHADLEACALNFETFSSKAVDFVPPPPQFEEEIPADTFSKNSMIGIDPPEHTALRKTANRNFTRGRVAALEPMIHEVANSLIDGFVDKGSCDLMYDFCYPMSLRVIVRMLGLPDEDVHLFRQWSLDHFALLTPKNSVDSGEQTYLMSEEEREQRWSSFISATRYYRAAVEARRERPTDDALSVLANAKGEDGEYEFDIPRIMVHAQEMVAAGHDTTANLIAMIILHLARDQVQYDKLKAQPDLIENVVEEGLRRRGTVLGMFRITTRDTVVGDQEIPQGSLLYLAWQAGGHDREKFKDAEKFDITRENAKDHTSFGIGRHFCMGAPLARLEAKLALEAFLGRIPEFVVPEQKLEFEPALTVSALKKLQVEWAI